MLVTRKNIQKLIDLQGSVPKCHRKICQCWFGQIFVEKSQELVPALKWENIWTRALKWFLSLPKAGENRSGTWARVIRVSRQLKRLCALASFYPLPRFERSPAHLCTSWWIWTKIHTNIRPQRCELKNQVFRIATTDHELAAIASYW